MSLYASLSSASSKCHQLTNSQIGVIVCLLSSGIQSIGLTLQRKSHQLEDEKYDTDDKRPPYRRRRWQLGFLMFLIANLVGSTIQLTTLPLPVLAALQAAGLVFNSICATLILGESFTRFSLAGTILVSGGAVIIAYYGALPEPAHNLSQLLDLFARQQFVLWAVGQGLLICAIFGVLYVLRNVTPSRGGSSKTRLGRGMCYGALSGMLSAHSLLMAKSAVELIVRTLVDGDNQFRNWQAWIIVLALVCIGLSQLYCLHCGLQLCSTSVLYPFIFCVYNVTTILNGLIYFNQSSQLSSLAIGLIVLGTLILICGVFCLSYRLADETPLPQEISENPLQPPVGVIGSPFAPEPNEREPLLPKPFRPNRAGAYGTDEESQIGINRPVSPDTPPRRISLDKFRKRATFADFPTNGETSSRRAVTNPVRPTSSVSTYQKARRKTLAASKALWGELEEAPSQFPRRRMSDAGAQKHAKSEGDHAQSIDEEGMSDSAPLLLQRTGTGRTYRDSRRRRSMPGLIGREQARRAVEHSWHTLDSSAGRPEDGEAERSWWRPSRWKDALWKTRDSEE